MTKLEQYKQIQEEIAEKIKAEETPTTSTDAFVKMSELKQIVAAINQKVDGKKQASTVEALLSTISTPTKKEMSEDEIKALRDKMEAITNG